MLKLEVNKMTDTYLRTVELIRRVEPFCRDSFGQDEALDHLAIRGGLIVLKPKVDAIMGED